jgi:biopolymer transport protein TolR
VAVDDKGDVFVMDQPVAIEQLADRIQSLAKAGFDERIYVRGSRQVNYGRVAQVMSIITSAGYKKVALVTEQEKK